MKSSVLAITALLATLGVTLPASAQVRCWHNGNSIYCRDVDGRQFDRYDNRYYDRYYDRRDREAYLYRELNQIYWQVLGRPIDASGFRTYSERVKDGKSLEWVRDDIARSREANTAVNRVYRQVLGRDADPSGLDTYTEQLEDGWSLREVRRDVIRSDEARDRRQTQRQTQTSPVRVFPRRVWRR
jgi:hypothetical protein